MSTIIYLLLFLFFIVLELFYFKLADHFNIIDRPNERSSHSVVTIRGGGVIFVFAAMCAGFFHPEYWIPILGMVIIGVISFIDDRITISGKIRIVFHLIAVSLLFYYLQVFQVFPWWMCVLLYIFTIGIINAYNFMDGINGITGAYSLVILGGLQFVNYKMVEFIEPDLIWLPFIATVVFLIFNFRKKAKCFAGDVGSVTIAFWIVFLLLQLIFKTENYAYLLFLAVYGVDTVLTIIHRIYLKQNIFDAHRLHFYQILANEQGWPQLIVSSIYAIIQLGIILAVIYLPWSFMGVFLITTTPLALIYCLVKPRIVVLAEM